MKLPDYVTVEEVRRVCRELKIRDWTKLKKPEVTLKEAKIILPHVNTENLKISPENFRLGLEVELEHGTMFKRLNVTNNHPILTGKIVMAHFMEMLDYYKRLQVAEVEGDILKAVVAKNMQKIQKYYRKLAGARMELGRTETSQLKG
ncbi:MAG TPA: DUF5661 family protein [Thermodesulfovibrionales bacterium]|jgi:hypothetical protein|nr:DUF5661 family protein [Thermodesulfovibrionales bacterium]